MNLGWIRLSRYHHLRWEASMAGQAACAGAVVAQLVAGVQPPLRLVVAPQPPLLLPDASALLQPLDVYVPPRLYAALLLIQVQFDDPPRSLEDVQSSPYSHRAAA